MFELVRAGRKPGALAKEFGCHPTSILGWVRLADEATGVAPSRSGALSAAERQELMELRRKLRQVQMERDVLVKATASRKRFAVLMRREHMRGISRSHHPAFVCRVHNGCGKGPPGMQAPRPLCTPEVKEPANNGLLC